MQNHDCPDRKTCEDFKMNHCDGCNMQFADEFTYDRIKTKVLDNRCRSMRYRRS